MRKFTCLSLALLMPISTPAFSQSEGVFSGNVGIFACDAPGNKQKTGAIIGAVAGGIIANKVSKDNKTLATVLGAAVGGAAGSYIGCRLQRKDQEKLAKDSERALVLGQDAVYENTDTGIYATTNVTTETYQTKSDVRFATNVVAPTSLNLIGGRYAAPKALSLKSSALSTSKTIGTIAANQEIDVLGHTNTKTKWAAVEKNGVVIGYVPLASLNPLGQVAMVNENARIGTKTQKVNINGVCREVNQTLTQNGQASEDGNISREACVQTDGSWKTS